MSKWLFLRGEWDERTQKSIDDNDDMWINLACELTKDENDSVDIIFKGDTQKIILDNEGNKGSKPMVFSFTDISSRKTIGMAGKYDYVFARGGFDYYSPMLRDCKDAYKVRYGAGCRFMPEPDIDYQLILVDTEHQKRAVLSHYPKANVHLLIKPAAVHFKPIECEKEYDVCYIANHQQARIKGVKWVYDTVPRDLKVLQLGYIDDCITPPPNIARKRVDRIDMPKWISKCKIGIVPYDSIDSCPRVIPEMSACGLPVICLDTVNIGHFYKFLRTKKSSFWEEVVIMCDQTKYSPNWLTDISEHYQQYLSLPVAAKYLKDIINE